MKESKELKLLSIRMELDKHKQLRKLAYLTEKPIAELIRNAVDHIIKENGKVLTNSDIAV